MSQSQLAPPEPRPYARTTEGPVVVDAPDEVQRILHLLEDADCRAILEATSEDARSAAELCDACDLPSSTVYRKLDRLTDAGLLDDGLRVRINGTHTREYCRRVDDVVITVGDDGRMTLEVSTTETPELGEILG